MDVDQQRLTRCDRTSNSRDCPRARNAVFLPDPVLCTLSLDCRCTRRIRICPRPRPRRSPGDPPRPAVVRHQPVGRRRLAPPRRRLSAARLPAGRPAGRPTDGSPALSPPCLWRCARRAGVPAAGHGASLGNPVPAAGPGAATVLRGASHDRHYGPAGPAQPPAAVCCQQATGGGIRASRVPRARAGGIFPELT